MDTIDRYTYSSKGSEWNLVQSKSTFYEKGKLSSIVYFMTPQSEESPRTGNKKTTVLSYLSVGLWDVKEPTDHSGPGLSARRLINKKDGNRKDDKRVTYISDRIPNNYVSLDPVLFDQIRESHAIQIERIMLPSSLIPIENLFICPFLHNPTILSDSTISGAAAGATAAATIRLRGNVTIYRFSNDINIELPVNDGLPGAVEEITVPAEAEIAISLDQSRITLVELSVTESDAADANVEPFTLSYVGEVEQEENRNGAQQDAGAGITTLPEAGRVEQLLPMSLTPDNFKTADW
ncbi:hypothetical protein [Endozoicomonas euniceicola]|uniref:Uncharacterized protein n=1 Tax=Endozoicomonas euniceicola TaxID=1234143 RepID=A0ABY6GRD2_9GAMM|nr:hypothetical protein [Endozoicomonas euniceicola]UYM15122.1 hypothetical protein NX720_19980 [Endozoicomonas euniceicola]